jgi:hypothetical protein
MTAAHNPSEGVRNSRRSHTCGAHKKFTNTWSVAFFLFEFTQPALKNERKKFFFSFPKDVFIEANVLCSIEEGNKQKNYFQFNLTATGIPSHGSRSLPDIFSLRNFHGQKMNQCDFNSKKCSQWLILLISQAFVSILVIAGP